MIRKLVTLLIAFFAAVPLFAQNPVPAKRSPTDKAMTAESASTAKVGAHTLDQADLSAWLDGYMPYAIDRGQIVGAVVVVVKDGQILVERGYGYADLASKRRVDPETTLFRPGSISKLFTWTAVMQQVEAGKLDLDTDVNRYIDFKIPVYDGKPVTLRNILTHTAGFEESIRHLISSDPKSVMPLSRYAKEALPARITAPGSTPAYSNYATALAGYIVERVSGMPFDDYIDERIFKPLNMKQSTFRQPLPARFEKYMSSGYPNAAEPARPFEIVIPAPAGSLSASGADMAKFMIAHLQNDGTLLKPETMKEMHDTRAPSIGPLSTMALGFYEQWANGRRAIAHGGDTELFHSDLWLIPEENVGIYISMNSSGQNGAAHAIRGALMQKFADRYFPEMRTFKSIDDKLAREHAQMMAGTYVMSRGAFTNFMSVLGLMSPTTVSVGPDGKLQVPSFDPLSAGIRDWVEIEPFVWRDANTGERLAADVKDGRVVRFSIDTFSPFTVLEPAPASTNGAWLLPALLAALAIAIVAALAWPVRAVVRRNFKAEFGLSGRALLAYRLTRICAWLVILALIGWIALVAIFSADIGAVGGKLDWLIQLLRTLTPLASFGLLGTAIWHLVLCFRDGRRWTMKLGAALLALSGAVLSWVTVVFHLYGYGMVY